MKKPFDYSFARKIQPASWLLLVIVCISCKQELSPGAADASLASEDPSEGPVSTEPGADGEQTLSPVEETTIPAGILGQGDEAVAKAVGRAPRSRDISLARQAAANRARLNLINLLKQKGYSIESPGILRGATIERYWTKGRFVYALGVLPLSDIPGPLNHTASDPSNTPEDNSINPQTLPREVSKP